MEKRVVSFEKYKVCTMPEDMGAPITACEVQEQEMVYRWFEAVPDVRIEKGKFPLVVQLHGGGLGTKELAISTGWPFLAKTEGFIAVFPTALKKCSWDIFEHPQEECDYIVHIIQIVCKKYQIDETRIYLAGMSLGDMMSLHLACRYGNLFAGLGSYCGPTDERYLSLKPKCPIPVFQVRGEKDLTGPGQLELSLESAIARKHAMICFNLEIWKKANHAERLEVYVEGSVNALCYKGGKGDLIYLEIKDMWHVHAPYASYLTWKFCFERYQRVEGKLVERETNLPPEKKNKFVLIRLDNCRYLSGRTVGKLADGLRLMEWEKMPEGLQGMLKWNAEEIWPETIYISLRDLALMGFVQLEKEDEEQAVFTWNNRACRIFLDSDTLELGNEWKPLMRPVKCQNAHYWVPLIKMCEYLGQHVTVVKELIYIGEKVAEISSFFGNILVDYLKERD